MKRLIILGCTLAMAGVASANLMTNGSFETGPSVGTYTTLNSGSTAITGWTVGSGSVDYIGTYWDGSGGGRSIDLGGNINGSIYQDVATVIGQTYILTFDMAGNFDGPSHGFTNFQIGVTFGASNQNFNFTSPANAGPHNMGWTTMTASFVATTTTTRLTFTDLLPPSQPYGPALDKVTLVSDTPEPFTMSLGLAGIGLFVRRRLKSKRS
jgi:choice-of-anchor C domain-containing protein